MRGLNEYIIVDESRQDNLRPASKKELKELIKRRMKEQGPKCDLNDIDVSNITDMGGLFIGISEFNGDISKWNVSRVEDMSYMFSESKFNGDISKWDVSNVEDMSGMFSHSTFNGDISKWDVSKVQDMKYMFEYSKFSRDISKWNVSRVPDMEDMFFKSPLDGHEPDWYNE